MANNNHFDLRLDTLAPTGSIARPGQYINANGNLAIAYDGTPTFMKVWFNSTAVGSKSDSGYTGGTWEAVAQTKLTGFVTDGIYYYHMVLMDSVNNESGVYDTDVIVFDTTVPTVSNFYLEDPDTASHNIIKTLDDIVVHFEFNENGSGPDHYVISGDDIQTQTVTLLSGSSVDTTLSFLPGTADGQKTISVVVYDKAGNQSVAATHTVTLDTQLDVPTLALQTIDGSSLPAYINYNNIIASLTSADTDITGYKIWEGSTEPSSYTPVSSTAALSESVTVTLSNGDGPKTINAKVIDGAGNEASPTPITVTVDSVPPAVSLTPGRTIISNVSGFDTSVLSMAGTDATAGIRNYVLTCGGTSIASGNASVPATFSLTSANSMVSGLNVLELTVVDNAGNQASVTAGVTLDITAPSATIGTLNAWYTDRFPISLSYSDNIEVSEIYAWINTTSDDESVPAETHSITPTASPQTIAYTSIEGLPQQTASNYVHVKVVDSVGNVAYDHAEFGYDSVKPSTPTVTFTHDAYNTVSAEIGIVASDETSGLANGYMKVLGDIANPTADGEWEAFASSRSVQLSVGDGIKHVTVQVKDVAGNVSDISAQASCELDTTKPTGSVTLFEPNGTSSKANVSPVAEFVAHISAVDDQFGGYQYKIYGDFTTGTQSAQGITEANAEWQDYEPDSGLNYKTISNLVCTSGDGDKMVYLKLKDNAGNENESVIYQKFTYDTSEPTVAVSNIDYQVISKVNSLRRNSTGTIAGKYSDECNFTFTPNERIQAYKVCAYEDEAAARTGSHNDSAIPTTAGSINMSATGLSQDSAVNATIKGADFETALGGITDPGDRDGAHIVVVYVQDMGGTWSVAAEFAA